jgi:hypothetical protein
MRKHRNHERKEHVDLVEQARLKLIPSKYPIEFAAICKLGPFKEENKKHDKKDNKKDHDKDSRDDDEKAERRNRVERKDLLDYLKLELADIVTVYKRRLSDKGLYFTNIDECIRLANTSASDLRSIVDRLAKLDGSHIETLWAVASEIDPNGFTQRDCIELLNQLSSMMHTMRVLTVALPFATGVSGNKRGQGRPPKPYFEAAMEMISLWEIVTAESKPPPYNPDVFFIEAVKTAKKEVKKGEPDIVASKDSIEFCRLVFRMIDPNITLPQVRTAINNARRAREMWLQFLDDASSSRSKESLALRYCRFLQKRLEEKKRRVKK